MIAIIVALVLFLVLTNGLWTFKYLRLRARSIETYKKLYQQLNAQLHGNNQVWDEYVDSLRHQLVKEKQKSDPDFELETVSTHHTVH